MDVSRSTRRSLATMRRASGCWAARGGAGTLPPTRTAAAAADSTSNQTLRRINASEWTAFRLSLWQGYRLPATGDRRCRLPATGERLDGRLAATGAGRQAKRKASGDRRRAAGERLNGRLPATGDRL